MQPALAPAPQPLHTTAQDHVSEQILREQLLASAQSAPSREIDSPNMQHSSPASSHDHNPPSGSLDHNISNSAIMSTSAESGGEDNGGDGRKGYGKRELSTSKRAAQNRAAQRAFRQRKEGYIKKLEEQVRDYALLNENYKAVQAENYQLRDYIINLQSRLIESHGEFPQPPSNIDLPNPSRGNTDGNANRPELPDRPAAMDISAINQLKASASQVVQDLGKHSHPEDPIGYTPDVPAKKIRNLDVVDASNPAQEALQGSSTFTARNGDLPPPSVKVEMRSDQRTPLSRR